MRNSPADGSHQIRIPVAGGDDTGATTDIVGRVWLPTDDTAPRGVLVVHPATATPEWFYARFAEFVTEQGLAVVTYDYRGTGASGDPRRHRELRMRDWMQTDVPAVSEWAREAFPDIPRYAVGHSIGGHALTLGYGLDGVTRFALVASHVAATHTIPDPAERLRVSALLTIVGPAFGRTLGYVPGRRFRLGEDIPAAAMFEWSRWARLPHYFFSDPSMHASARAAQVTVPALAIGASDDPWGSPAQIDELVSHLTGTTVERQTFTPADLGVRQIGHHGLLRRGTGERAWPTLIRWLTTGRL